MPQRLSQRLALCLQFLAGIVVGLPGVWEFAKPNFFEPGLPIGDLRTQDAPRHRYPFRAVVGDNRGFLVEASLCLADFFGNITDIDDALGIKLWPVIEAANDVR